MAVLFALRSCLKFLIDTRAGRIFLLVLVLGIAVWRFNDWAYNRGYAAAEANVRAAQIKAEKQSADWLARANAIQQSNVDSQKAADEKYAAQKEQIHKTGGGDAKLDPYLANAARILWPSH